MGSEDYALKVAVLRYFLPGYTSHLKYKKIGCIQLALKNLDVKEASNFD